MTCKAKSAGIEVNRAETAKDTISSSGLTRSGPVRYLRIPLSSLSCSHDLTWGLSKSAKYLETWQVGDPILL